MYNIFSQMRSNVATVAMYFNVSRIVVMFSTDLFDTKISRNSYR